MLAQIHCIFNGPSYSKSLNTNPYFKHCIVQTKSHDSVLCFIHIKRVYLVSHVGGGGGATVHSAFTGDLYNTLNQQFIL